MVHKICNKCFNPIINYQCPCGWHFPASKDYPPLHQTFIQALKAYDFWADQNDECIPYLLNDNKGNLCVLFKGTEEDLLMVERFILNLNKE